MRVHFQAYFQDGANIRFIVDTEYFESRRRSGSGMFHAGHSAKIPIRSAFTRRA